MALVSPSLLSADFVRLADEIARLEGVGCDWLHIDVMDGVFVPNITIGMPVVKAIRGVTSLPLDVHLMIDRPGRYIGDFLAAGSDLITIHAEADTAENIRSALKAIRAGGAKAGLSLKPGTPARDIEPFLPLCDLVLVMTVEPGFGGQSFLYDQLEKIRYLKELSEAGQPELLLEVDGGINIETAALCRQAGIDVLVSGSSLFRAADLAEYVRTIRG